MSETVEISLEFTPNPNSLKYVVNRVLLESGAASFSSIESATPSPLAVKLLNLPGLVGVMLGRNFITITKSDASDWDKIHQASSDLIKAHLENNETVLEKTHSNAPANHSSATGEIETKIKEILEARSGNGWRRYHF